VPEYGTSGRNDRYIKATYRLVEATRSTDILDYGCGKRTLEEALGFPIANYDPAIPGLDGTPEPHDLVVCTDVLEHIEPECLDDVLADIRRCTKLSAFVSICLAPSLKVLADGRNAHLILESKEWWLKKLKSAGFGIVGIFETVPEVEFVAQLSPHGDRI